MLHHHESHAKCSSQAIALSKLTKFFQRRFMVKTLENSENVSVVNCGTNQKCLHQFQVSNEVAFSCLQVLADS